MELNVNSLNILYFFAGAMFDFFFVNHTQCIFCIYSLNSRGLGHWLSVVQQ